MRRIVRPDAEAPQNFALLARHFLVHQRLRHFDRICGKQLLGRLTLHVGANPLGQFFAHVCTHEFPQPFDTTLGATEGGGEIFVQHGHLLFFHSACRHLETHRPTGQFADTVLFGKNKIQRARFARGNARETGLEAGDHFARAERDRHVFSVVALERFALHQTLEAHDHAVAVTRGALSFDPFESLATQTLQHLVNIFVRDLDLGTLQFQRIHAGRFELRIHLQFGGKGKAAVGFVSADLEPGGGNRREFLLRDCFAVMGAHQFVQHLLAHRGAVLLAHDLIRCLARAKSLDLGRLSECLQTPGHLRLDLLTGDSDG